MIDGSTLEHAYKYTWSGFPDWKQRKHAEDWVLLPQNLGIHLSIDESCLHEDLFTILTNKDGHGRQGTVIAMVRGTKAEDVIKVLVQLPEEDRKKVEEVTMDLSESMRSIVESVFPNARITLDCGQWTFSALPEKDMSLHTQELTLLTICMAVPASGQIRR